MTIPRARVLRLYRDALVAARRLGGPAQFQRKVLHNIRVLFRLPAAVGAEPDAEAEARRVLQTLQALGVHAPDVLDEFFRKSR